MDCIECSICNNAYNTQEYRPRVLPCGHSYCTNCLAKAFQEGFKSCPTCRKSIHLPSPHNLPINFDLEGATALMSISANAQNSGIQLPASELCNQHGMEILYRCANHKTWLCNTCRHTHYQQGGTVCSVVSKNEALRRRKINHHKYIDKDIEKYFQDINQIEQYAERLAEEEMKHEAMINRLEALLLHHRQVKSQLQTQQQRIDHILKDAKDKPEEFEVLKNKLSAATSIQEITDVCQEALKKGLILKEYGKQIRKKAICIEYIISSLKVRVGQSIFTAQGFKQDYQNSYFSPMNMNVKQDMMTLLKFWCTTNNRTESGMKHVFAYTALQHQGKQLYAPLTVNGGHILLHVLQSMESNKTPTTNAIIPYKSTRELVRIGSAVVFLDLTWPGSQVGRIFIRLMGDTVRCRQFLSLCTGEQGYSYVNTCFHYSSNKGRPGEMITAGDYDGKGALPLLSGLTTMAKKYQRPITAGLVSGVWDDDDPGENALFGIYVRDDVTTKDPLGFAEVEEGMDVVRRAAAHSNIKDVRIVDCGVVLPSDAFEYTT